MTSRIALCRFVTTVVLFSGVACCVNAAPTHAHEQEAVPPVAPAPAAPPAEAAPSETHTETPAKAPSKTESGKTSAAIGIPDERTEPDLESSIAAFLKARAWLDSTNLPDIKSAEAAIRLPGTRGVAVILRNDGRVVGVGTDWPGGGSGDDYMLRRAVGRAVGAAFGDRVIGALPRELRDQVTKQLALELEFAARPEPLLGRTFVECVARLDPGLDGIALRRGGGVKSRWAASYPSIQYATNSSGTPERLVPGLLQDLELPMKDLADLVRIDPVGTFRFSSLRLAQSASDGTPLVRGRGAPRVADGDVTDESTRAFALATLDRLEHSVESVFGSAESSDGTRTSVGAAKESSNLGILGNYLPVPDEYKPYVAPPTEQALVAWAAASVAASERFDPSDRAHARMFAIRLINELGVRMPGEDSASAKVAAMAFALCAVSKLGGEEGLSQLGRDYAEVCRQKLVEALDTGNAEDRPLAALAAAMMLSSEHHIAGVTETRAGLDAAWGSAAPPDLVGNLPWLVLAEGALSHNGGGPVAHIDTATTVAKLLMAAQAGFGAFGAEFDVRGGFRLTGKTRGGVTSQSLRPGFGLMLMLSHPGCVADSDRPLFQERARALLRFAFELAIDESESRFFQRSSRAKNGIRAALWDSSEPVAANAMAILVAVEALDGLFTEGPRQPILTIPESNEPIG